MGTQGTMAFVHVRTLILVASAIVAAAAPARAQPRDCVPVARLTGNAELVAVVGAELADRRIELGDGSACGVIEAVISREPRERIAIRIRGFGGRSVVRSVEDVSAAATAIESWVRRDVTAPLLAGAFVPSAVEQRQDAELPAVDSGGESGVVRAPALAAGIVAELGAGLDGSTWRSTRASVCIKISTFCAGALLRYAVDNRTSGDSAVLNTGRNLFELMATLDRPVDRGHWSFVPGLGIGQGSLTLEPLDAEDLERYRTSLRVRVHSSVAYRLGASRWLVQVQPELTVAPFAERKLATADSGMTPAIAADPRGVFRVGVGLVLEAL